MEGTYSNFVHVVSGIPQGTILGFLIFLCQINYLPLSVDSKIRLFADDCLIYREINSIEDKVQLQKDLDSLQDRASTHKSATFYLLLQLENRLPIFIN